MNDQNIALKMALNELGVSGSSKGEAQSGNKYTNTQLGKTNPKENNIGRMRQISIKELLLKRLFVSEYRACVSDATISTIMAIESRIDVVHSE